MFMVAPPADEPPPDSQLVANQADSRRDLLRKTVQCLFCSCLAIRALRVS